MALKFSRSPIKKAARVWLGGLLFLRGRLHATQVFSQQFQNAGAVSRYGWLAAFGHDAHVAAAALCLYLHQIAHGLGYRRFAKEAAKPAFAFFFCPANGT